MVRNEYFSDLKTVVFDIETTGLVSSHDRIISACFCDPDTLEVRQLFCEDPAEEALICEETAAELSGYDAVITYNGDSFDLPFLRARLAKLSPLAELPELYSIDLFRWLRLYWPVYGRMERHSQKDIEAALGLTEMRTDPIRGGDCRDLYYDWLRSRNAESKEAILLHNADDVRQLARITSAVKGPPYGRLAFAPGFPVLSGDRRLCVNEISLKGGRLIASAKAPKGELPADIYTDEYHAEYDSFTGDIKLEIPLTSKDNFVFTDVSALPFAESLSRLEGLRSGYLVISSGASVNYDEACVLVKELILHVFG